MSDDKSGVGTQHSSWDYFVATVLGVTTGLISITIAVVPGMSVVAGSISLWLLWAWAIGAATGLHAVPWIKENLIL